MEAIHDGYDDAFNDLLSFNIRMAHGLVYRHFVATFSALKLTQKQLLVLWLVDNHPNIAQTDLAQRMHMDRATLMAIVNRLQDRNYVVRGPCLTDRRKQSLNLSPIGVKVLATAKLAIAKHEGWLRQHFTHKEIARLTELLGRIQP